MLGTCVRYLIDRVGHGVSHIIRHGAGHEATGVDTLVGSFAALESGTLIVTCMMNILASLGNDALC